MKDIPYNQLIQKSEKDKLSALEQIFDFTEDIIPLYNLYTLDIVACTFFQIKSLKSIFELYFEAACKKLSVS